MDHLTKEKRSWNMSHIRSKNTKPELLLRSVLSSIGIRYRLHKKDLPGKPDIYIGKYKTAIFLNGCFWHQHKDCKRSTTPKSKVNYWIPKLKRNVERQKQQICSLENQKIKAIIIWECEAKKEESLKKILLQRFIENNITVGSQLAKFGD